MQFSNILSGTSLECIIDRELSNFWLHDTVSAFAYAIAELDAQPAQPEFLPPYNDLTQFILHQQKQLPDFLQWPMKVLTLGFDLAPISATGGLFHSRSPAIRRKQIAAWKKSKLSFKRDLIRYYESLTTLALYNRKIQRSVSEPDSMLEVVGDQNGKILSDLPETSTWKIVVIGSGPGGAITACLLTEAGHDVLLIEEGAYHSPGHCLPFSIDEMVQKYRHSGQTVALGKNKVAYVEGRCVGGGSEINSGLYHRTPSDILEAWRSQFDVAALNDHDLLPHFLANEQDLSVSALSGVPSGAALKLEQGAVRRGWKSLEVPRWVKYGGGSGNSGVRQTMSRTFIPRFLRAGGRLATGSRALNFSREGNTWRVTVRQGGGKEVKIITDSLFVCGGAIQTPALLQRSGIRRNIGHSLQVHPTVKLAARFPEAINTRDMGVPAHQVKEFAPRLTFGCSVSTLPYLALGLLDSPGASKQLTDGWEHMANYYAMITAEGRGTVRVLPGWKDPLVRYALTENDRRSLADGLAKLSELLFDAGAEQIWPAMPNHRPLLNREDVKKLPGVLADGVSGLMTIHLFSSCPMGENKSKCAVDSFGQVHGCKNLFVADASILCSAPGVNPQGTIMALARRNAMHFLETHR